MRARVFQNQLPLALVAFALLAFHSQSFAAAPATFTLSPSATVIGVTGTDKFLAVYDPDGTGSAIPQYLDPSVVKWFSSNPGVLLVDPTGLAYGKKAGAATIYAVYKSMIAKATVTVAGTFSSYSLVTPDGLTRTYSLYVPDHYQKGAAAPLVLAYHGGGGNGIAMMHVSQFNPVARANTFIVAYPDGSGSNPSWNGGGCCGSAAATGVDDVEFTRMMIADISSRFTIDATRVYATGMSNGGVMANRLGVQLSDEIAAVSSAAGELDPGGDFALTFPPRAVSVLMFHGTTDQVAPYDPQKMQEVVQWWMLADGIPLVPPTVTYQHGIETCETNATATAEVTFCLANPPVPIIVNGVVYDGGGHAWPGGVKVAMNGPGYDVPTYDVSASGASWAFFARHPMTAPNAGRRGR